MLDPTLEASIEGSCSSDADCVGRVACVVLSCVYGRCEEVDEVRCPESPDPCSENVCSEATGECELVPRTSDLDGDGFRGPLPGFAAAEPEGCGSDCDDRSASSFPGGVEICDGVDNDCDGIIDNGQFYLASVDPSSTLVPVPSAPFVTSGRRDLAFQGKGFAISYWGRDGVQQAYLRAFDSSGAELFSERRITSANASTFGASLAFDGRDLAAAWSDARIDGNYEVYFTRFDGVGEKLGPDVRVTTAPDFSIHPRLLFDQGRYVVVWDDRREEVNFGPTKVFAQILAVDGTLTGSAVELTAENAEFPVLAATERRFGLAYTGDVEGGTGVRFRLLDKELGPLGDSVALSGAGGKGPNVVALSDGFLVTWETTDGLSPGPSIVGAIVSEVGTVRVGPIPLTLGATFARTHHTLSFGDRALLVWADDYDGNYEIYGKVIGRDLAEVEPRVRLSFSDADSYNPSVALGGDGRVGLVFDDRRTGAQTPYFLSLGCPR